LIFSFSDFLITEQAYSVDKNAMKIDIIAQNEITGLLESTGGKHKSKPY
jgi:hypothetical protein